MRTNFDTDKPYNELSDILLDDDMHNACAYDAINAQNAGIFVQVTDNEKNKQVTICDQFVINNATVYHFGASLKDLGKKWFAFSKMDIGAAQMLAKLGEML